MSSILYTVLTLCKSIYGTNPTDPPPPQSVIAFISNTSINISWDLPPLPVTGYKITLQPDGRIISVSGGGTTSYVIDTGILSDITYTINITSLYNDLQSTTVGPVDVIKGEGTFICESQKLLTWKLNVLMLILQIVAVVYAT